MINVLEKKTEKEFKDICKKIKIEGLDKRAFRLITVNNLYSLSMEITDAELAKII